MTGLFFDGGDHVAEASSLLVFSWKPWKKSVGIDGMNDNSVIKVFAETGTDMSHWQTEKHFSSWLGLSPNNKITAAAHKLARTIYSKLKNATEYVEVVS